MTIETRDMSGGALAEAIVDDAARRATDVAERLGRAPRLATVLVGDDPASETYVRMKRNRSKKAGIESHHVELSGSTTTEDLIELIESLSADDTIDGILLQHPVPSQIDERLAFEAIAPDKDVDGVTLASFASMAFGLDGFASCTPGGIIALLDAYGVELTGAHAVVIGRSSILGKPLGMLLLQRNSTVTFCHSRTVDLPGVVRTADIVVAAVGRPEFVRGEWMKEGAVVIDAGYNEGNIGDVHHPSTGGVASLLTPVPGGVGPMTIAMLMRQTIESAERRASVNSAVA
jgi:methylenetetrahydrofolate dehydrogenase (NADP+)/methenyltetrahydrofolate cyclohydrolase